MWKKTVEIPPLLKSCKEALISPDKKYKIFKVETDFPENYQIVFKYSD